MGIFGSDRCKRFGNKIVILHNRLNFETLLELNRHVYHAIEQKSFRDIIIDLGKLTRVYPNGLVPLVSILDHYRAKGLQIIIEKPVDSDCSRWLDQSEYFAVLKGTSFSPRIPNFRNSDELNAAVTGMVMRVAGIIAFKKGQLGIVEWIINEVCDNVLNHSGSTGRVCLEYYSTEKKISFCVADHGRSIPVTMRKRYSGTDEDLIFMALEKGITSDPKLGQGNGLAGLLEIVNSNQGSIFIVSKNGSLQVVKGRVSKKNNPVPFSGTVVSFDIFLSNVIPSRVFGTHEATSVLEIGAIDGELRIKFKELASNLGNRETGKKIRTILLNAVGESHGSRVVADLSGFEMISSSCADEIFGKLFVELGICTFSNRLVFDGVNQGVASVINRAVLERAAEAANESK